MEEDDFGFSICIVFLSSPADRLSCCTGMAELVIVGGSAEKFGQKGKRRRGGDWKIVNIISAAYNPAWDSKCFERIPAPWRYLTSLKAAEKGREK